MRENSEFLGTLDIMEVEHKPAEYQISRVWNISDLISTQNNLSISSQTTQFEKLNKRALNENCFQEFLEKFNSADATNSLFLFFESNSNENPSFLSLFFESNELSSLLIDDDHLEVLLKSVFLLKLSFMQSTHIISMLNGIIFLFLIDKNNSNIIDWVSKLDHHPNRSLLKTITTIAKDHFPAIIDELLIPLVAGKNKQKDKEFSFPQHDVVKDILLHSFSEGHYPFISCIEN